MSLVTANVSSNIFTTSSSCTNASTHAAQSEDHSSWGSSMVVHRAVFALCTHRSRSPGQAVRNIRPENLLLTLFSSILIVSILLVTPTTAIPLLPFVALQLCAVSKRQYSRDCRGCSANRSMASITTIVGRGREGIMDRSANKCAGGGSEIVGSSTLWSRKGFSSSSSAIPSGSDGNRDFPVCSANSQAISRIARRSLV